MVNFVVLYLGSVALWGFVLVYWLSRLVVSGLRPSWFQPEVGVTSCLISLVISPFMLVVVGAVELRLLIDRYVVQRFKK